MITFDTNIFCGLTALLSNILLIISVHRKEEGIPALNKETTTTFKGYLAIVILMHHFSQYTTFEGVFSCLKIYKYVGYIFSHNMVGTTNGKLLLKSVARIYLTWVIICCIFAPIILYGGNDFRYFLQYTFLMGLRIQANGIINGCWFIIALIFLYVSHYYTEKYSKNSLEWLLLLVVCWTLLFRMLNVGIHWYSSIIAYPFGVMLFKKEKNILGFLKNTIVRFGLYILSIVLFVISIKISHLIIMWLLSMLIPLSCFSAFTRIKLHNNILFTCGTLSLEIFLIHIKMLDVMLLLDSPQKGYMFWVMILLCLASSYVVNYVMKKLCNMPFTKMIQEKNVRKVKKGKIMESTIKAIPVLYERKEDCCGCTACYAICPKSAISMQPDEEGFDYPIIDSSRCVCCSMCLNVCPNQGSKK